MFLPMVSKYCMLLLMLSSISFANNDNETANDNIPPSILDDDDGNSDFSNRQGSTLFQSLCPNKQREVKLDNDNTYKYRPDVYYEVECNVPFVIGEPYDPDSNKMLLLMFSSTSIANNYDYGENLDWIKTNSKPMTQFEWKQNLPWLLELNTNRHLDTADDNIPPSVLVDDEETSDFDYGNEDLEANIPYGISNVRSIMETRKATNRHLSNRRGMTQFQSLCPHQRRTVKLDNHSVFQYRPDQYDEVECNMPFVIGELYDTSSNKVCGRAGFTCVQLNRTIFLTRRKHDSDCWEPETRVVMAGCECMWPKHTKGDIASQH